MLDPNEIDESPLRSRWWKVWCCKTSCCLPCNKLLRVPRKLVSQNKKRYRDPSRGFDLDLTYVTPRVIVCGFPAAGLEHFYRNPRDEVRRFLQTNHANSYKVYNLASEPGRGYKPSELGGPVERYPFADHTCPPLEVVIECIESCKEFLDRSGSNVVTLHCKAGKGRAGIMACCLLLRIGIVGSAREALGLYDRKRTVDGKGLTQINQRKFVHLYERVLKLWFGFTLGNVTDTEGTGSSTNDDVASSAVPSPAPVVVMAGQAPGNTLKGKALRCKSRRAFRVLRVRLEFPQLRSDFDGFPSISTPVHVELWQQDQKKGLMLWKGTLSHDVSGPHTALVADLQLQYTIIVEGTFMVRFKGMSGARSVIDLWATTGFLAANKDLPFQVLYDHSEFDVSPAKHALNFVEAGTQLLVLMQAADREA
ncbi:unnamed protein product [Chrysoparadoxa australica]